MLTKAMSFGAAAVVFIIYQWSMLRPNDALFLFVSNNLVTNILLVALTTGAVRLAFLKRIKQRSAYIGLMAASVSLAVVGLVGILSSGFAYAFFSVFGMLDFVILLEVGIVFSLCALSVEHQPVRLRFPSIKLTDAAWLNSLNAWSPDIGKSSNKSKPIKV
jgi:hypothetical protein